MIDRQAGLLTQRAPSSGTDEKRPPLMTINAEREHDLQRTAGEIPKERYARPHVHNWH